MCAIISLRKKMKTEKKEIEATLKAYEPLICKLSYQYYASSASSSLELDDFLQEARIGCMNALDAFDDQKGNAFSSFIENGIRMALRKLLSDYSRFIRFPKYRIEQIRKLDQAEATCSSDDEISRQTGFSASSINKLRHLRYCSNTLSLDASFLDFLGVEDFSPKAEEEILIEKMEDTLNSLGERASYIVKSLSGSFGEEKKTKRMLSKELSMSCSKIREAYENSLTTLRKAL